MQEVLAHLEVFKSENPPDCNGYSGFFANTWKSVFISTTGTVGLENFKKFQNFLLCFRTDKEKLYNVTAI